MFSISLLLLAAIIMLVLDSIYLSLMKRSFSKLVQSIQHTPMVIRMIPVLLCYLFLQLLFYYFLIYKRGTIMDAFILGVGVYGVYETTNFAIFKNWDSIPISVLDTIWGGILFASTLCVFQKVKPVIIG